MKTTTKKQLSFGKGSVIIPENTIVEIRPIDNKIQIVFTGHEKPLFFPPNKLFDCFTGFTKCPSEKTLAKHLYDGITTTPRGKKVELDGVDEFGFKSWFIYLGLC